MQLLDLTAAAIDNCPGLIDGTNLYGVAVHVGRQEGGRNARMWCKLGWAPRQKWQPEKAIDHDELWKNILNIWGVELVFSSRKESENGNLH